MTDRVRSPVVIGASFLFVPMILCLLITDYEDFLFVDFKDLIYSLLVQIDV